MAKTPRAPKTRKIRMSQFKSQLEDAGIGMTQPVEITDDLTIELRLGVDVDAGKDDDFLASVRAADSAEEMCRLFIVPDAGETAEDLLEKVEAAGYTPGQLAALWASATQQLQEELGKLRPRRS